VYRESEHIYENWNKSRHISRKFGQNLALPASTIEIPSIPYRHQIYQMGKLSRCFASAHSGRYDTLSQLGLEAYDQESAHNVTNSSDFPPEDN
jgi:hypothetical protein